MSFGSLTNFLTGEEENPAAGAAGGAERGTVRNLIARLANMVAGPQAGPPLDISTRVTGNPMGEAAAKGAAADVPADVGDPAAVGLDPTQKAFLNAVAHGESRGRYDVRYTPGGGARFGDLSQHPGIFEPGPEGPSSAAGRYQFTKSTWNELGGGPFDPVTQDIRGTQLAEKNYHLKTGRDLWNDLKEKGFTPEIAKALSDTWTSFRSPQTVKQAQMIFNTSLQKYGSENVAGDVIPFSKIPQNTAGPSAPDVGGQVELLKQNPGHNVRGIPGEAFRNWFNSPANPAGPGGMSVPVVPGLGTGPNAAPNPGGPPRVPPLSEATPAQEQEFMKLVSESPKNADLINQLLYHRYGLTPETWQKAQNQNALPEELKNYFSQTELRKIGMERLKQMMLYSQGIDTPLMDTTFARSGPSGYFNDQPTFNEKRRGSPSPAEKLQDETDIQSYVHSRPYTPYGREPLRKRNWMKT